MDWDTRQKLFAILKKSGFEVKITDLAGDTLGSGIVDDCLDIVSIVGGKMFVTSDTYYVDVSINSNTQDGIEFMKLLGKSGICCVEGEKVRVYCQTDFLKGCIIVNNCIVRIAKKEAA